MLILSFILFLFDKELNIQYKEKIEDDEYSCEAWYRTYYGILDFPESVKEIGNNAFKMCHKIIGSLIIPDYVTKIGKYAFYECSGLNGSLKLPNSLKEIGDYAFYGCTGLTGQLIIPGSLEKIGQSAFAKCSGLTGPLNLPDSLIKIDDDAFFYCSGLNGSLTIPKFLKEIKFRVFGYCSRLSGSLNIPNSVIRIGNCAFEYCSGFTGQLILPNSVIEIGWLAFNGCSGFTGSLSIPDSVVEIESDAFRCSGMNGELVISGNIKYIGTVAFELTNFKKIIYMGNKEPYCPHSIGFPDDTVVYLKNNFKNKGFCTHYTQLDTQPNISSESETQPNISSESETQPNISSESETQSNISSESETQSSISSESETQPSISSESETQSNLLSKLTKNIDQKILILFSLMIIILIKAYSQLHNYKLCIIKQGKEYESLSNKLVDQEKENEVLSNKLVDQEKENEVLNNKLVDQEKENEVLNNKLVDQEKENEVLSNKLVDQEKENEVLNNKLVDQEKEIESLSNKLEIQRKNLELLRNSNASNPDLTNKLKIFDFETIQKMERVKKISEGSQSKVYEMIQKYALKVLKIKTTNKKSIKDINKEFTRFIHEYEILNALKHPNIIVAYGFCFGDGNKIAPSMLLEICPYNLSDIIEELSDVEQIAIIYEISSAMMTVHEKKVIHRDLKPQNIILDQNKHVKICDFGISYWIDIDTQTQSNEAQGTLRFMAPELFNYDKKRDGIRYNEKVDVYSFGIVVYYILTKGEYPEISLGEILRGNRAEIPDFICSISREFIKKCWSAKPEERPSFEDIIEYIKKNGFHLIDGIDENKQYQIKEFLSLV